MRRANWPGRSGMESVVAGIRQVARVGRLEIGKVIEQVEPVGVAPNPALHPYRGGSSVFPCSKAHRPPRPGEL